MSEISRLNNLIQKAKNGYENYKHIFDKMSESYLLNLDINRARELFERNKSAVYFPKINAKAKRIMDALSETYFSTDRFCEIAEYINSNPKVIEKWQNAIDFYADQINLYKIFQPEFLKVSFIGTSTAKVFWDKSEKLVKIEILNIDDVYFDPDAVSFNDCRFVVNRLFMTKNDIYAMRKKGVYKFNLADIVLDDELYERYEIYDIYEQDENGNWKLSTLYENNLLRSNVELNDGLPFVSGYMLPQVKKIDDEDYVAVYGEPNLASILPLQEAINNTANSIIDGVNGQLKPKLIIDKNAQISRLDIETIGKPIFASNPTAIGQVPPPNISGAFNALEIFDRDMSDTTGISPQLNGVSTSRAETATMSSIMANEGSTRLQGYIRTYNETFFEPIFERFAELVWKYGEAIFFAGYSRKELGSYRINLNTGIGSLNKEVQKNSLVEAGGLLNSHLQMCMGVQDMEGAVKVVKAHRELVKRLLPLYGIKNIDDIFKESDEFIRDFIGGSSENGDFNGFETQGGARADGVAMGLDNSQIAEFGG